jgi:hypothetical protein
MALLSIDVTRFACKRRSEAVLYAAGRGRPGSAPKRPGGLAGRFVQVVPKGGHALESTIPACQRCGRKMIPVAPSDGIEAATWQCLGCDCPDPLKSERVEGWVKSSLRPPT